MYDGESYMDCEEVIFAAPTFRVGIYGYLCLGTEDFSGNMGLKDILEALRWVKENISAFGGDPKCISIFGFSSGSNFNFTFAFKIMKIVTSNTFPKFRFIVGSSILITSRSE